MRAIHYSASGKAFGGKSKVAPSKRLGYHMTRPGSAVPVKHDLKPAKFYLSEAPDMYKDDNFMQDLIYSEKYGEQR